VPNFISNRELSGWQLFKQLIPESKEKKNIRMDFWNECTYLAKKSLPLELMVGLCEQGVGDFIATKGHQQF
jgi:hypothetical protein